MNLDKHRRARDGKLLGDWKDVKRCEHDIPHGTDGHVCPVCHRKDVLEAYAEVAEKKVKKSKKDEKKSGKKDTGSGE